MIISGFPCIGKSYFCENSKTRCWDSDSSAYSWSGEKLHDGKRIRNPDFPNNYINHIVETHAPGTFILVSTHKVVREALSNNMMPFVLVYPNRFLKEEYLERARKRGSTQEFINIMDTNWDTWVSECEAQHASVKICLGFGETLSTIIEELRDNLKVL
jgi:hypothetical protein